MFELLNDDDHCGACETTKFRVSRANNNDLAGVMVSGFPAPMTPNNLKNWLRNSILQRNGQQQ